MGDTGHTAPTSSTGDAAVPGAREATLAGGQLKSTGKRDVIHIPRPVIAAAVPLIGSHPAAAPKADHAGPMKHRSRGFTLFELMVVLALAAVILGLGAPQFRELTRNNRMVTVANDFLGGIQTARTEAIKRQMAIGSVAMCPSANPDATSPTCLAATTRQFNGWIVFVDTNNNCDRDTADITEIVLRAGPRIDTDNTVNSHRKSIATGACISFAPTGFIRTDTGRTSATRTLFCDERGNTKQNGIDLSVARGVDITATGRARITRDVTEIAGWTIACPP